MIVLFIVEYFYRKTTVSPRTPKEVFLSPDFILSIAVFLLFIAVFIIRLVYNDKNDMFEIGKFHNTYFKARRMNYANNLDGIILMFQVLKLILFIRVTNYASLIYPFFVESFKIYLCYFIFILTLLLGFAIGGKLLYGYDMDEFNNYGNCFVSMLLFLCGYYNVEDLVEYNEGFTIVFVLLFSTWKLFFIFPVIHAILAEMFRRAVISYGYPSDMDHENWNMNDYKTWVLHFIPERIESNAVNAEENKKA